jgi:hypothetical protein
VQIHLLALVSKFVAWKLHGPEADSSFYSFILKPPKLALAVEGSYIVIEPLSLFPNVFKLLELPAEDN